LAAISRAPKRARRPTEKPDFFAENEARISFEFHMKALGRAIFCHVRPAVIDERGPRAKGALTDPDKTDPVVVAAARGA
jgi:hypothetical protein